MTIVNMGGIWSDEDIRRGLRTELITVDPFPNSKDIQPASLDLRLGTRFCRYKKKSFLSRLLNRGIIDPRVHVGSQMQKLCQLEIIMEPNTFLLGVTMEKVTISNGVVARVEGKSSIGRLGIAIHTTAGFIDPGFSGYITLELSNLSPRPIRLYSGMRICQIAFSETKTPSLSPYSTFRGSHYAEQLKPEPVVSKVNEQQ